MTLHPDYYPAWVCGKCGVHYGHRSTPNPGATWHEGECGVCGKDAEVTEPRDFGHLRGGWRIEAEEAIL